MFRSLEACIHERLAIIEEVITKNSNDKNTELEKRVEMLEKHLRSFEQKTVSPASENPNWFDALKDLEIVLPSCVANKSATSLAPAPVAPVARVTPVVPVAPVAPVARVAPVNSDEEEFEEVDEEEEVEEEEEEEEVKEIVYKGKTYYMDSENNIYAATGDELGNPIGTWDVSRERVLFKRQL